MCDPDDYSLVAEEMESSGDKDTSVETRRTLALKVTQFFFYFSPLSYKYSMQYELKLCKTYLGRFIKFLLKKEYNGAENSLVVFSEVH